MPPGLNADWEAPVVLRLICRPWLKTLGEIYLLVRKRSSLPGLDSGWNAEQGLDEIL